MATDYLTVKAEFTPLDLLLWRHYKRSVPGLVEAAFARNPGLADLGVWLPVGTVVAVERPAPAPAARKSTRVVSLYD